MNRTTATTFSEILAATLRAEGGYVAHPDDPGGETILGISRRAHPDWPGWAFVDAQKPGPIRVTPEIERAAEELYRARYWNAVEGEALLRASPAVAAEVFDTAVNMGVGVALRFLRRALRALLDPELDMTGQVDPHVLDVLQRWLTQRGRDGEDVLVTLLNAFQAVRYVEIVEGRPASRKFLFGWIRKRVGAIVQ